MLFSTSKWGINLFYFKINERTLSYNLNDYNLNDYDLNEWTNQLNFMFI